MKGILEFVTVFCSVSCLVSGLYLLKPSGKAEKAVRYIFSLIFICAIAGALLNFNIEDFKLRTSTQKMEIPYENVTEYAAQKTFETALKSKNINFSKITVCTDKKSDGSINIIKVIVYSKEEKQKISTALGGNTAEYEIEVIYE